MKIKLDKLDESINYPELCAVTGRNDKTLSMRPLIKIYFLIFLIMKTVHELPMTDRGWNRYRRSLTGIDRFLEKLFSVCLAIPLLGYIFCIIALVYIYLPLLPINLFIKLVKGRAMRVAVKVEGEVLFVRGICIEVPSEKFANEFVDMNSHLGAKIV